MFEPPSEGNGCGCAVIVVLGLAAVLAPLVRLFVEAVG